MPSPDLPSFPALPPQPPRYTRRLFVCEKTGDLELIPDVTAVTPAKTVFLNVDQIVTDQDETFRTSSEIGLLAVAFHPEYAINGNNVEVDLPGLPNRSLLVERFTNLLDWFNWTALNNDGVSRTPASPSHILTAHHYRPTRVLPPQN